MRSKEEHAGGRGTFPQMAVRSSRTPSLLAVLPLLAACHCGDDDQPRDDGGMLPMELPVIPGEPNGLLFDVGVDKDGLGEVTLVYATTLAGGKARLFYTPIPSHSLVHSGSPALEYKVNFQAYPLLDDSQLEDTDGGSCEDPEICRVPEASLLMQRVPLRAPARIRVTSVTFEGLGDPNWSAGTLMHWNVRLRVGDVYVTAGHIGWIAPELRQRILDAGGGDTEAFVATASTPRTEFLPEGADIVLEAGEVFAYPQLNKGCFQRVGRHCIPFDMIEFTYGTYTPAPEFDPLELSPYRFLSDSLRADMQAYMWSLMDARALNYGEYQEQFAWLYLAEGDLETQTEAEYREKDSIFGRYGDWYENSDTSRGPCPDPAPLCNEGFFLWRVRRDTPVFDSSLYENPNVHMLMVHSETGPGTRNNYFAGEVLSPDDPDDHEDTIITKWRVTEVTTMVSPIYQAYRYQLVGSRLTVVKGNEHATRVAAEAEAATLQDPATAVCNGTNVVCLYRNFIGGLPGGN